MSAVEVRGARRSPRLQEPVSFSFCSRLESHRRRRLPAWPLRSTHMAVAKATPPRQRARRLVITLIAITLYLMVGVAVLYNNEEGWTMIDAIYFCMATMSTVGYGDFSPKAPGMRTFTMFSIFIGVGVVFPLVADALGEAFSSVTSRGRELMDKLLPPRYVDLDGDGGKDYQNPGNASIYYTKKLLPSLCLILLTQGASAAVFAGLESEWTFWDAWYHCVVTVTTVGYGDQYIATQEGRLFSAFHMMIGVCLFAEVLSTLDSVRTERALAFTHLNALQQELTPDLFERLSTLSLDMRPDDMDLDGLTDCEFALMMLLDLGIVDKLTIEPFLSKFRAFDVKYDGRLSASDVRMSQELKASGTLDVVQKRNSLIRQNTITMRTGVGPASPASMPASKATHRGDQVAPARPKEPTNDEVMVIDDTGDL